MQRNRLMRQSMGVAERGVSTIAQRNAQRALDDLAARQAAADAARAAKKVDHFAGAREAVLPALSLDMARREPVLGGAPDGDLGWGRYERPASVATSGGVPDRDAHVSERDFGWERPASVAGDYAGSGTARRDFFDTVANHAEDMVDPRFAQESGRRRKERVQVRAQPPPGARSGPEKSFVRC
jgi:hypothetical protein